MRNLPWCASVALLSIATASQCLAADSPWSGTWKENISKGKLTGESVTITPKGSGYHFTNGPVSYDFACDGKPYPTVPSSTISCKPTSDGGFDLTQTTNGQTTMTQHRTFSPDGKLMIMKGTIFSADGSKATMEMERQRKSGTTGLVGEWVDSKVAPSEPAVQSIALNGNMLHIEYPRNKASVDAKLDGSDCKVNGPRTPPGATIAFKSVSPKELSYVDKLNGKVMAEGTFTLSPDGKTFTDVSWSAGKQNEKTTEVYEKQ